MFGSKHVTSVHELLERHVETSRDALDKLREVVTAYNAKDPEMKELAFQLHKIENEADDIRRETQSSITAGTFLPFYRQDYILLSNLIDDIANRAVDFAQFLYLTQTDFLPEARSALEQLADAVRETCGPLPELIHELFREPKKVDALADMISGFEQKCDSIEWKLLKQVFEQDISRAEKLIQTRLVQDLSRVADAIENAADRTRVIVLKQAS